MINSFSEFLIQEENTVYFTLGRMNPPTRGHELLLNTLAEQAKGNPYKVYISKSQDAKKNPLMYTEKVKFARKMFPKHARHIIKDEKIRTVMDIAVSLYEDGYKNVVMVTDGPRSREFEILLDKYNGVDARHGFYKFESMKFVSCGERNDISEDIEGVSATKQRGYAADNNFASFCQGLTESISDKDSKALFNAVRRGMGLDEQKEFKNHIQLEPVSELREAYVKDGLFAEGDQVVMHKHDIVGNIKHLGSNYVIVESKGETWRCWLNDVSKVSDEANIEYDEAPYKDPGDDGIIRESLTEAKWTRGGPDGEVHTKHNGQHWRVRKNYDHNDRHTGEYRIEVKKKNPYGGHDWEWHDTVHGKEHAKSRLPEEYKYEWGTDASAKHARKMTPGQNEEKDTHKTKDGKTAKKGLWYNIHQRRKKGLKPKKPGDKGYPKTLNIEQTDAVAKAKQKIDREKAADAIKHDQALDRARLAVARRKNRETDPIGNNK